ncbi:MAG TPA: pantoate--beta-alanine ligase [Gemmatimonadota bacterium]|nr:pantoate--beta-alanine ligase [Gemmatimonadota bacterium]
MNVLVANTIEECRSAVGRLRPGRRVALVPTMGALHEGHLSLVDLARQRADIVVVSVFVNPTQFGPNEDFDRYPRDLDRDVRLAAARGAAIVFAPETRVMYPQPLLTTVTMRGITDDLEGAHRPGHFDGVLTIVAKLFHVVEPDVAIFGQKDAQQAAAIRRMVADLDFPIEIVVGPTVREPDGLALSSRNAFLSSADRKEALALHAALDRAGSLARQGVDDAERLLEAMREELSRHPEVSIDYVAIVERDSFRPVRRLSGPAVAAVAAHVGGTRLIDNVVLEPHER